MGRRRRGVGLGGWGGGGRPEWGTDGRGGRSGAPTAGEGEGVAAGVGR